jgi:hypothetical protein
VVQAVGNHICTALDLHDDCLGEGHTLAILQPWQTTTTNTRWRPHHVVNLGLNAALHIWFARHVEQAPGEGAGGQQTLFLQVNSQF